MRKTVIWLKSYGALCEDFKSLFDGRGWTLKSKAISSLLVIAVLAPGCSTRSPQGKEQQSGAAVQTQKDPKRLAIEKTARELIAATLGVQLAQVQPHSRFIEDLGADDLDIIEIIMRFEEEFEIVIPDEDAAKLLIVQQAYDYLVAHVPRWPKN
jgi:acyl carrier protein